MTDEQNEIAKNLLEFRNKLLDLTLRNRLLNFRESKGKSISITTAQPDDLHKAVEKGLELCGLQHPTKLEIYKHALVSQAKLESGDYDEKDIDWTLWAKVLGLNVQKTIPVEYKSAISLRRLVLPMSAKDFEAGLNALYLKKESLTQEIGANALYIVYGFVEWVESGQNGNKRVRSPLLVQQTTLIREKGSRGFRYSFSLNSSEDVVLNRTLKKKFADDFGIALPEYDEALPENDLCIEKYLALVRQIIQEKFSSWQVKREVCVAILDFTKLAMWEDLDPENWLDSSITSNENINRIILGGERGISTESKSVNIDSIKDFERTYPLVFDADSAQTAAVMEALNGRSLVIEGPPGTGKSQTIANLIAVLLSQNKRILFASEKLAALEVVKHKLDAAGLGDFCLNLHSKTAEKGDMLRSLKSRLQMKKSEYSERTAEKIESEIEHLENLKKKLNEYCRAVSERFAGTGYTNGEILVAAAKYAPFCIDYKKFIPAGVEVENADRLFDGEHIELVKAISQTASRVLKEARIDRLSDHPWHGMCSKSSRNAEQIRTLLSKWTNLLEEFEEILRGFEEKYPELASAGGDFVELAAGIDEFPKIEENPLAKELLFFVENKTGAAQAAARFAESTAQIKKLGKDLNFDVEDLQTTSAASEAALAVCDYLGREAPLQTAFELFENSGEAKRSIERLDEELHDALNKLSLEHPEDLARSREFLELFVKFVSLAPSVREAFAENSADALKIKLKLEKINLNYVRNTIAGINQLKESAANIFDVDDDSVSVSHLRTLENVLSNAGFINKLFGSDYKNAKREIESIAHTRADIASMLESLGNWIKFINEKSKFDKNEDMKKLYGSFFKGVDTDCEALENLVEWHRTAAAAKEASSTPSIRRAVNELTEASGAAIEVLAGLKDREVDVLISEILNEDYIRPRLAQKHRDDVFALPSLIDDLKEKFNLLEACCSLDIKSTAGSLFARISAFQKAQAERISIIEECRSAGMDSEVMKHFGLVHEASESELESTVENLTELQNTADSSSPVLCRFAAENLDKLEDLRTAAQSCREPIQQLKSIEDQFFHLIEGSKAGWFGAAGSIAEFIERNKKALAAPELIYDWTEYMLCVQRLRDVDMSALTDAISSGEVRVEDIENVFNAAAFGLASESVFARCPNLRNMPGMLHKNAESEFVEIDARLSRLNIERIRNQLLEKEIPWGFAGNRVKSFTERTLIEHEIGKTTRHISNRELMKRAWGAVTASKPCFMMSPLTVSQYLRQESGLFDVVIMDEASQIKPEDAIGVIARSKQVIIVGDPQQLPPTNFFEKTVMSSEDEEDASAIDESESILDLAWKTFNRRTLNWHYRSRHESLIAFSNKYFYDDRLIVFPSPCAPGTDMGIKYQYVGGTFNKRINAKEAWCIAQAVRRHSLVSPDQSFGVVAMNSAQSDLILEAIEKVADENEDFRNYLDQNSVEKEPWFVKNLENVQGDERDVIFISMTYGPYVEGGAVRQNFGPISGRKGDRRLNVLFSRAKIRMEVFSSMHSSSIKDSSAGGAKVIKRFLEFCETGILEEAYEADSERGPDSIFEEEVMSALVRAGFECRSQIGVRGYFIDIGVVDPDDPTKFILGIECDGATYHSSASARERDRLRQNILENLGWKIARIWSTDWFESKEREVRRIVKTLEEIVALNRQKRAAVEDSREEAAVEFSRSFEEFAARHRIDVDFEDLEEADLEEIPNNSAEMDADVFVKLANEDSLRTKLLSLKEEAARDFPDTPEEHKILRDEMLELFIKEKPIEKEEFIEIFPSSLRQNTSGREAEKYLPKIFKIIEES